MASKSDLSDFRTTEKGNITIYESSRGYNKNGTDGGEDSNVREKLDHQNEKCNCYECSVTSGGLGDSMRKVWSASDSSNNKTQLPTPTGADYVNAPTHYNHKAGTQVIDEIQAALTNEEFRGYLLGSAMKYMGRFWKKGDAPGDIRKTTRYLTWYLEFIKVGKITHE